LTSVRGRIRRGWASGDVLQTDSSLAGPEGPVHRVSSRGLPRSRFSPCRLLLALRAVSHRRM